MYAGPKEGLVKKHDLGPEPFHGVDGFNGVLHDRQDGSDINLQNESAALGLVQLSKIHKEALHVICFAPLTNIALAMKVDENFAHRVRQFYSMGGNFEAIGNASISAEFNFLADPEAAYVVLRNAAKPITLVPWELCFYGLNIPLVMLF